ncbi:NIPSNAP family protein [Membranihabitans marinus]|uniref:NIPSNAP family protein n=1 Tax=Membranihabitans marinus TaxID=1227546 RepID=UPI001F1C738E|nr:NIPSNAP family protein [Membranihabitans marinus]
MIKYLPAVLCLFIAVLIQSPQCYSQSEQERDWFELRIYHVDKIDQINAVEKYLEKTLLPAFHSAGVDEVGVFKPVPTSPDFGKKIYVFIPYNNYEDFIKIPRWIQESKRYHRKGKDYLTAPHDKPPFNRVEKILMKAFDGMPKYQPSQLDVDPQKRVYELRSYESPTEYLGDNKIKMFNEGEIDIFDRLGFNAIFYGEVVIGPKTPNLMYMTTFASPEAQAEHWDAFRKDPEWLKLKVKPEFQDNVSHIDKIILYPTKYSDL